MQRMDAACQHSRAPGGGERRCPVFEHHLQPTSVQILARVGFHDIADADAFQHCDARKARLVECDRAAPATATRDLAELVASGALRKEGELKHTRYYLNLGGWLHGRP